MQGRTWTRVLLLAAGLGALWGGAARAAWFIRGDVNASGAINITDAVQLFRFLFLGDAAAVGCQDAADADDDGKLTVTDGIYLLSHLFQGRPGPKTPIRGCWYDATDDALACPSFEPCKSVAVLFICDKSGSMNGNKFKMLQREVVRTIEQLSDGDQLGIFFSDAGLVKFPVAGPTNATQDMKTAAVAMLMSTQPGHGACGRPALAGALAYAAQATAQVKEIVYLSDGFTSCPGFDEAAYANLILSDARAKNTGHVAIHAVCIGATAEVNQPWMKKLAAENGGSFVRVER